MMTLRLVHRLGLPLVLLTAIGCGGDDLVFPTDGSGAPSTTAPAQLEMVSGNGQSANVGEPLPQPLIVRVFDDAGDGIAGQKVNWVITGGGGAATPSSATTDDQGLARTTWTMGNEGTNSIDAVVAGVGSVSFSATADKSGNGGDDGSGQGGSGSGDTGGGNSGGSGGGNGGSTGGGTGGSGGSGGGGGTGGGSGTGGGGTGGSGSGSGGGGGGGGGTAGTVPSAASSTVSVDPGSIQPGGVSTIRVTVRDATGVPVSGAVVTLTVSGSGNTVTQPAGPTGADGVATGTITSTVPGTKDIVVTVNGSVQVNQTAQVVVAPAPPTRVVMVGGNNQSARTGQAVAVAPAVRVTDAEGRPVAGFGVTFAVTEGGGSVVGAFQLTNEEGIARVGGWTLGAAGPNTLEAGAGSLQGSPVVFHATATEPPPPQMANPDHFVFRVPPHDVGLNQWFDMEVAIVDANGNIVPLNGTQVYVGLFELGDDHPNNGQLAGDRFVDTRNGVATFRLYVKKRGSFRFLARSDYLPKNLGPYGPELFSNTFEVR
jgi:Big-like domain-containing protein